jgi:hypothetical protein
MEEKNIENILFLKISVITFNLYPITTFIKIVSH